jgi:transposase InsO family protein
LRTHGPTAVRYLDDNQRRRLAYLGHRAGWKHIARDATIVSTNTLRRWYRTRIAPDVTHTGGKPRIDDTIVALIVTMAQENSWGNDAWGRRTISDVLNQLGIEASDSSVRNILNRHGIPPAPDRGRGRDEPDAVVSSADNTDTVAIDFCSGVVGLGDHDNPVRCAYILLAIHIASRAAAVIGITTRKPDAVFMEHCAHALVGPDGFLTAHQATRIRMDHDGKFTDAFKQRLTQAEISIQQTDVRCPWQNGHVERFVKTFKYGILRKAIWTDEAALRYGSMVFIHHYLTERPHQALGGQVILPPASAMPATGSVMRRQYLGGLINHYYRAAV